MARNVSWRLVALVSIIAALSIASFSASSASAAETSYCGYQHLSNFKRCSGVARNLAEVSGIGWEKSVCVGAGIIGGACSSGPLVWVANGLTPPEQGDYYAQPWIEDNAAGETMVYGAAWS